MKKIELEILTLTESNPNNNSYVVLLSEKVGERKLPIIIGNFEAQSIAIELENMKPIRPLTHDLMKNVMNSFQILVKEVVITDLREGVFYSQLHCIQGDKVCLMDARTSDAISLAIRFRCPIYTFEKILDMAGVSFEKESSNEIKEDDPVGDFQQQPSTDNFEYKDTKELKDLLNKALSDEDYELAARIRDELTKRLLD